MKDRAAGHRLVRGTSRCVVEAWAPDRPGCLAEALEALVGAFAVVPDSATTRVWPLVETAPGAEDELISLFEDVIDALDVFGVVPARFHLAETEDGGIAGDMEVVPAGQVRMVGPAPKGVSSHGLSMAHVDGEWRCHALVDV